MKQTIFLDMDEVIADWMASFLRYFDYRIDSRIMTRYEIWEFLGISRDEFWSQLENAPVEFWEGIKPTPWANQIVRTVTESSNDVYVLSNGAFGNAATGKHRWLVNHFPELQSRLMLVRDKWLVAAPNRLLVDDSAEQVEKFVRAGGEAIMIDRPWNISHKFDLPPSLEGRVTRVDPMHLASCMGAIDESVSFDRRFCGTC